MLVSVRAGVQIEFIFTVVFLFVDKMLCSTQETWHFPTGEGGSTLVLPLLASCG